MCQFHPLGAHSLVARAVELAFSRSSGYQNPAPEVGQSHPAHYALPVGAVFPRDAGRSRYALERTAVPPLRGLVSQTASHLFRYDRLRACVRAPRVMESCVFVNLARDTEMVKIPRPLADRFIDLLCYAA